MCSHQSSALSPSKLGCSSFNIWYVPMPECCKILSVEQRPRMFSFIYILTSALSLLLKHNRFLSSLCLVYGFEMLMMSLQTAYPLSLLSELLLSISELLASANFLYKHNFLFWLQCSFSMFALPYHMRWRYWSCSESVTSVRGQAIK